ncbi:MAG: hypothetical protein AAB416_03535 [Patescibacteria group bacterium]
MSDSREELNKREITHETCGKRHIDMGTYAEKNHTRHLCYYCEEFFEDTEPGIGV